MSRDSAFAVVTETGGPGGAAGADAPDAGTAAAAAALAAGAGAALSEGFLPLHAIKPRATTAVYATDKRKRVFIGTEGCALFNSL